MQTFIDLFLHLDTLLPQLAASYGPWIYALLFLIIFAETGLVVTPILPGDSLLFAAGALAATIDPATGAHILRVELVLGLLLIAAILGDAVNYSVGHYIGPQGLLRRATTPGCCTSSSTATTWRRRTRSSRSTAARRWCSAAGCRSCGPSCRSSPAPAR